MSSFLWEFSPVYNGSFTVRHSLHVELKISKGQPFDRFGRYTLTSLSEKTYLSNLLEKGTSDFETAISVRAHQINLKYRR